jgi:hypothetical protein
VISGLKVWIIRCTSETFSSSIPFRQGRVSGKPVKSSGTLTVDRFLEVKHGKHVRKAIHAQLLLTKWRATETACPHALQPETTMTSTKAQKCPSGTADSRLP